MLYELRVYEAMPGRMKEIVDRFANVTLGLFKKHGVRPILFLEAVVGTSNQLTWLIEWENLAEREEKWEAFQSDPAWISARAESEKNGPLVTRFNNTILREVPVLMKKLREGA